jgi:hypothetical protein
VSSGSAAASIIAASRWQLPTIAGLGLSGWSHAPCAERLLRLADVQQRLAGLGIAEEDYEVNRVARA